jgi:hypothetical protein
MYVGFVKARVLLDKMECNKALEIYELSEVTLSDYNIIHLLLLLLLLLYI